LPAALAEPGTPSGITGRTRILGLIADPVAQARSPGAVNAMLQRRGRFGELVLVPMRIADADLGVAIAGLRAMQNFAGAVVSMPHKTAIVALLDELTPEAALVGAVNVVRRELDGRLVGTMLDGEGLVGGLRAAGHEVAGKACLLVGAGGAAAAVALALAAHGCASLAIVNRTAAKAAALALRVRQAFPAVPISVGDGGEAYDLAINATSLGMRPDDELPMSLELVERSALVAECVASPERTRLLELAAARGRRTHTGVPMLTAQMDLILAFLGAD
jgi:shikimate dehydrogenase